MGVSFQGKEDLSCERQDDEITPSEVPSCVNNESSVVLDSYTFYSNPLWCEDFPPKDGNLFLEDESTLVGKDYEEKEGVLQGLDSRKSPFQEGENDAIHIASRPFTKNQVWELQSME
ncbi:hypothetical protein KY284_001053 [Solanum tuberosum]|nr:hypothetical protein KY284_001053 [Solanum tuberosum]